jgi:hypothetical protein
MIAAEIIVTEQAKTGRISQLKVGNLPAPASVPVRIVTVNLQNY